MAETKIDGESVEIGGQAKMVGGNAYYGADPDQLIKLVQQLTSQKKDAEALDVLSQVQYQLYQRNELERAKGMTGDDLVYEIHSEVKVIRMMLDGLPSDPKSGIVKRLNNVERIVDIISNDKRIDRLTIFFIVSSIVTVIFWASLVIIPLLR